MHAKNHYPGLGSLRAAELGERLGGSGCRSPKNGVAVRSARCAARRWKAASQLADCSRQLERRGGRVHAGDFPAPA